MSDESYVDDDDQQDDATPAEQDPPREEPGWRKRLEREAKEAKALKRENAFLKAGINPDDPKAKWLVKGYDGELTPDAIKAAAVEAGVLAAENSEAEVPPDERAAHERMATPAGQTPPSTRAIDDQIAEAQAAGNHLRVIALKQQRAAAQAKN